MLVRRVNFNSKGKRTSKRHGGRKRADRSEGGVRSNFWEVRKGKGNA